MGGQDDRVTTVSQSAFEQIIVVHIAPGTTTGILTEGLTELIAFVCFYRFVGDLILRSHS